MAAAWRMSIDPSCAEQRPDSSSRSSLKPQDTEADMAIRSVLLSTRPAFLILTPICILLGASIHLSDTGETNLQLLILILLGALCAHISVNTLNEFTDFISGLDLLTRKTPFSGGSGALPNNPSASNAVLITGVSSLLITMAIGIYIMLNHAMTLLPLGLIGVLIIITYTRWINRSPWLCLLAPGFGFGILMVCGTQLSLSGEYHAVTLWTTLPPFFLLNNLLLLNQYPDVQADAQVGRRTLPIVYGARFSTRVYGISAALAYTSIILAVLMNVFPTLSLIAVTPAAMSLVALRGAIKLGLNIIHQPIYLAMNILAALSTPLLLAVSLLISGV